MRPCIRCQAPLAEQEAFLVAVERKRDRAESLLAEGRFFAATVAALVGLDSLLNWLRGVCLGCTEAEGKARRAAENGGGR